MTKKITMTAIFLAVYLTLKTITPTIVIIQNIIQINISFVLLPVIGMLLGKKAGFAIGILADLISFFMFPTIFNPIFMFNEGLFGFLGGYFFHEKDLTFKRIFLSNLFIVYFGIVVMNTIALVFHFWLLSPNLDKIPGILTTALTIRLATATFVYLPLLTAILYFPRKQWAYLQTRLTS